MTCCPQLIQPFTNQPSMSVAYGAAQRALYGQQPNVEVYYRDAGGVYTVSTFNDVRINATNILIDFGGPNSGIVKIF